MLTDIQRRAQQILLGRLNNTDIAELTRCARNTVANWRKGLSEADVTLEDIEDLDDTEIRKLATPGAFAREHNFDRPDMKQVLFEISERGVTAKTLYGEYLDGVPDNAQAMSLTTFYREVEQHKNENHVTISFEYEAGEMVQADFVGRKKAKQPILLNELGKERSYEIFCAVTVKSRKTYAVAIESQAKFPVLAAYVAMFEFFGGVPVLLTIDNFAAAVAKPKRGEKDAVLTPEFQEFADHYQVGLKGARVRKPKDKALVENGVGILQNDVLAPLRNRRFFSLSELNAAISERVCALNDRPFCSTTSASRSELFTRLDAPGYRPLPDTPYEPGQWIIKLRTGRDYHVNVDGSRYSVPFRLANEHVNAKLTPNSVHLAHHGRVIATHIRSIEAGKTVTNTDHMPPTHQQASMLRLAGLKAYVREIGPSAERLIEDHFRTNRNPRATAKAAVRLRVLKDQYSEDRIEAACVRAIKIGKCSAAKVESILASGLDRLQTEKIEQPDPPKPRSNVRGASYFEQLFNQQGESRDV